jgi:ABC-2 type transport system permease protein
MIELFLAELKRSWIEFRRYPFEAFGVIFITTVVFYGLFLSARYIAGNALKLGDRLDSVIVGYVLWSLVVFIMGNIAIGLQSEAQTGTLEQLFLSWFGATKVFLMRSLASLTLQLMIVFSILMLILGLTGSRLNFQPVLFLPLITLLMAAYGVAFAIGSLALLFKRVQQLQAIFQFALLFLLATPTETWQPPGQVLAQFLPMTPGAALLRDVMARNLPLNVPSLLVAVINGAVYLGLGLLLFRWSALETKRRGRVGGY